MKLLMTLSSRAQYYLHALLMPALMCAEPPRQPSGPIDFLEKNKSYSLDKAWLCATFPLSPALNMPLSTFHLIIEYI